jgi:Ca2+-binding RTX toxin-like protein
MHAGDDRVTNKTTKTLSVMGGAGTDTVIGPDTAGTWTITGAGSGSRGSTSLSTVESLLGGAADDIFKFQGPGELAGLVDGGSGLNTLDYSSFSVGVTVNLTTGTASRTGGVANIRNVTGGAGGDVITGNSLDNLILAGAGNDTLNGGPGGNDILIGSTGNDGLTAGPGRSILIGGVGVDRLTGGGNQDLLIGNRSTHETKAASLLALMAEWKRTDIGYTERIDHLKGTRSGGLNGTVRLTGSTVINDNALDEIFGNGDLDWMWGTATEVRDRQTGEVVSP